MSGLKRISEARRLLHNRLREITMQKSVFNVELPYSPSTRNNNAQNGANSGRLDHWTESVKIIDPGLLMKPFGDKTCFN